MRAHLCGGGGGGGGFLEARAVADARVDERAEAGGAPLRLERQVAVHEDCDQRAAEREQAVALVGRRRPHDGRGGGGR